MRPPPPLTHVRTHAHTHTCASRSSRYARQPAWAGAMSRRGMKRLSATSWSQAKAKAGARSARVAYRKAAMACGRVRG